MYYTKTQITQITGRAYLRLITVLYCHLLRPFSRLSRKLFEFKRIRRAYGIAVVSLMVSATTLPGYISTRQSGQVAFANNTTIEATVLITEKSVRLPLNNYSITQKFNFFHPGIDMAASLGSPIYPIMDGVVISVKRDRGGFGNNVLIDHGNGTQSLYAHMATISVGENEIIKRDTTIGTIGSTGRSTGPHLHLQIWQDHGLVSPEKFLEDYLDSQIEAPQKVKPPKLAKVQYLLPTF